MDINSLADRMGHAEFAYAVGSLAVSGYVEIWVDDDDGQVRMALTNRGRELQKEQEDEVLAFLEEELGGS